MSLIRTFARRAALLVAALAVPAAAQAPAPMGPPYVASYADLADLAGSAPLVVRARVRKIARVEDARAPGLRAGNGRFYIEAQTLALVSGAAPLGPDLAFLADLPVTADDKPPVRRKADLLLFAGAVPGAPGQLTLVAPDALYLWDAATEQRLRAILAAMFAPDAPAPVTGVREIIHVPGNLVGEGETQVFLTTRDGSAASLTIAHHPGAPPQWGASFSELTADVAHPPPPDTLAWYRLACFLPDRPPPAAEYSQTAEARAQALADYDLVIRGLGGCPRGRAAGTAGAPGGAGPVAPAG